MADDRASLVEVIRQFQTDMEKMHLVVETLAAVGDSCEGPVAIQAREALGRLRIFPNTFLAWLAGIQVPF